MMFVNNKISVEKLYVENYIMCTIWTLQWSGQLSMATNYKSIIVIMMIKLVSGAYTDGNINYHH